MIGTLCSKSISQKQVNPTSEYHSCSSCLVATPIYAWQLISATACTFTTVSMKFVLAQIPKGASRFHNTNQIAKYVYPFSAFIQRDNDNEQPPT